jgi:hypothetical protein
MAASKTEGIIKLERGVGLVGKATRRPIEKSPIPSACMSLTCAHLLKIFTDPGAWQLVNYCPRALRPCLPALMK